MVVTVNGNAKPVVQHPEAYQAQLDRVAVIEGIQRGLADVKASRVPGVCRAANSKARQAPCAPTRAPANTKGDGECSTSPPRVLAASERRIGC